MKYLKRHIFTAVLVLSALVTVHAQTSNSEIKPGPNAQQFQLAASSDNSLHTGQLSVNIPLFNLQGNGIDIPISLAFSAGSITHKSEASSVGLGWSLLAGGVITQTIRGQNDRQASMPNNLPWYFEGSYLQNKLQLAQPGAFMWDLDYMNAFDLEPDVFNYSYLGSSGDIYLKRSYPDLSVTQVLTPDRSSKLEKIAGGYKITDNKGAQYFFETQEQKGTTITSWFLSKITTVQGGIAQFHYANDNNYDVTRTTIGCFSKRLVRIDYDYGYVIFNSAPREDMYYNGSSTDAQRINSIQLYNKAGNLVKGYELNNSNYFQNANPAGPARYNKRLKLHSIREFGPNSVYKLPYVFEYDHVLSLAKDSDPDAWHPQIANNTWAHNPGTVLSVDRNLLAEPILYLEWILDPNIGGYRYDVRGYSSATDPTASTIGDYLSLTKMKVPTGGEEVYSYEPHGFEFVGSYSDPAASNGFNYISVRGKRLKKKEIKDNNGTTYVVDYLYDDGVLINPSIHNSTMYTPKTGSQGQNYLEASPYYTQAPQNQPSGLPVYYAEVEEVFSTPEGVKNGKKIYSFEKMYSLPPENYIYLNYPGELNYPLISLPNILLGKQIYNSTHTAISGFSNTYASYLSYPVLRLCEGEMEKGKILKEVILNASGDTVRKVENQYTTGFGEMVYSYFIQKFEDTNNGQPKYRYLISQMKNQYGAKQLLKRTTTNYYPSGNLAEEQTFAYTNLNLLRSSASTTSKGESLLKEYSYPTDISFETSSGLSSQASALKAMKDNNIIGVPVQTILKRGSKIIGGSYIAFKQLTGGNVVADSVFSLPAQAGLAVVNTPEVNSTGKVIRNPFFTNETAFTSYDQYSHPVTVVSKDGAPETVVWGYNGQYPIAKLSNYTYADVQANSALLGQLAVLDDFNIITDGNRALLATCNQAIRNSLPAGVMVTTYTYNPLIGQTSESDAGGVTTYYEYDDLQRLSTVKNIYGSIMKQYSYDNYYPITQPILINTGGGGGPETIYIRLEISNSQTISEYNYTVVLANVKYRFYSDAACTQPYTLILPLTFNIANSYTNSNNGGMYDQGSYTSVYHAAAGASEVNHGTVEQSMYYETGYDPVLGTLYEYMTSGYSVMPGDGYVVAP